MCLLFSCVVYIRNQVFAFSSPAEPVGLVPLLAGLLFSNQVINIERPRSRLRRSQIDRSA